MGRRELKKELLAILASRDREALATVLRQHPAHLLLGPLFSALCHPDLMVRGHAALAFGMLVPGVAVNDMEAARIVMRRFLWSLNEESGGIGWGAPEAMAAILGASPALRREYLHLFCSYMRGDGPDLFQDGNYLELPMLQRGLLAAVGDLCRDHGVEMRAQGVGDDLRAYLSSPDHQVVGLAIRALGYLGEKGAAGEIAAFLDHPGPVQFFDSGEVRESAVGTLAAASLDLLGCGVQQNEGRGGGE